ncbi:hypothetical protein JFL43_04295 [Viridibacillus sp. YIM B01967]|uniref:RNA polymerase alpha subunit C-terminal domain-containing protein n=1 Tax=Viridibacillus soli TaxID=2798301 RepID=A0ABS1H4W0_9BACL|nr:DNA-directed RNA polymerase subunit alpha C-terminal domain-containing protein [Viridibacillus soli]MBK3494088.1 hypothetical protein [Viridibacillus soli]
MNQTKEELLDQPIELLDLPPRVFRALKRPWLVKFNTVRDLVEIEYSNIPELGPVGRETIKNTLSDYLDK